LRIEDSDLGVEGSVFISSKGLEFRVFGNGILGKGFRVQSMGLLL
jgi:hypothetical protein